MSYKPIESYGVIGDLHTVALVGMDGSIDWCCLPSFDSPSVFAAILDDDKGGFFRLAAAQEGKCRQMYLPGTNILLTRFLSEEGVGEVTDFMPVGKDKNGPARPRLHRIVRIARAVRGSVRFCMECRPEFNYARDRHELRIAPSGARFDAPGLQLRLCGTVPLVISGRVVLSEFVLDEGKSATFILSQWEEDGDETCEVEDGAQLLRETTAYWRSWLSHCNYRGRWREMVERSALVLKLLTYQPTGAIVAAATCSLPEQIGGSRNWDYRYTWVRDAAFTVYAFLRLGFTEEAERFIRWLEQRAQEEEVVNGPLNVIYGIDGRHDLPEETLDHFEGYRGSQPVRVGNEAYRQLQLDIYGELIDSVYLYNKHVRPVSYDLWRQIVRMLDWVAENWELPDDSIWEVRGGRRQFVYSKMQCWVALDRGLRMAQSRGLPMDVRRLQQVRDRIYEAVMQKGWDPDRGAFCQAFGSDSLDAANLLMPLVLFTSATDPRMLSTVDNIVEVLVSDSLVYRYQIGKGAGDGLSGREGTFSMCTFWLVEALARAGRLEESRFIFEKMHTYANHVGLYSEEIGPSGEALGNFPQAFTHLGLISAAYRLDRALEGGR